MKNLIDSILTLSEDELLQLLPVMMARYSNVSTDRDLVILSMSKDPQRRRQEYDKVLKLMEMELDARQ